MRPTDTHCKTCGKEYKNSLMIIIVIAAAIIAICIAAYFFINNKNSGPIDTVETSAPVKENKPVFSNWILDSETDPISGTNTYVATVQALDFDTKTKVNSEFTVDPAQESPMS